jgi:hypothetical protein
LLRDTTTITELSTELSPGAMTGEPAGVATRLTLDVDPHMRPISGFVADDTRRWQFSGWVELAAALHSALEARSTRSSAAPE